MTDPRIPTPVLEAARPGVGWGGVVMDAMRTIEEKVDDPAERWRVLRGVLAKMVRGEV